MEEREDVYKTSGVPHRGQPYEENGRRVYWTNISQDEARNIQNNGMNSTDLATGEVTPALRIQTFGGHIFAQWEVRPMDRALEQARDPNYVPSARENDVRVPSVPQEPAPVRQR